MEPRERFWVVGGEYRSLAFDRLVDGTQQIMGPFPERGEAEQAWRQISEQHRHVAAVRFTIASEQRVA